MNINTCPVYNISFESISELPKVCAQLASELEKQPNFNGNGSIIKNCKVISLTNWSSCRICAIFNQNSETLLNENSAWKIHSTASLKDSNNCPIKNGLTLWDFDFLQKCTVNELKTSYERIIEIMKTGWFQLESSDREEFFLYRKQKKLIGEVELINAITSNLSFVNDIDCFYSNGNEISLYIRISRLNKVKQTFNI